MTEDRRRVRAERVAIGAAVARFSEWDRPVSTCLPSSLPINLHPVRERGKYGLATASLQTFEREPCITPETTKAPTRIRIGAFASCKMVEPGSLEHHHLRRINTGFSKFHPPSSCKSSCVAPGNTFRTAI